MKGTPNTTASILFVGAITQDTLYSVDTFSEGSGKYLAKDRVSTTSGSATAAATAAVRLGGKAILWSSLGCDKQGDQMVSEIVSEGVNCQYVRRVGEGRSASAAIIVDKLGERWVVVDYDPLTQCDPGIDELPPLTDVGAVMADVRWPGAARLALKAAQENGIPAILDADVASAELLISLAGYATHIVASSAGAALMAGTRDARLAVKQLRDRFDCFVCITQGADGLTWLESDGQDPRYLPGPQVDAVDTNAAGDVFHGAFTQALVEGVPVEDCLRFASAAAALKCKRLGGRLGAPNRLETLAFMERTYGSGV